MSGFSKQYPLDSSLQNFLSFLIKFSLFCDGVRAKAMLLKSFKRSTFGFFFYHTSNGVLFLIAFVGDQMYATVFTAFGMPLPF